jgi:lipopolysaccharide export system permease protein
MRLSPILSVYIGRHFLWAFIALFVGFLMIIMIFDLVETMRRAAPKPEITLVAVVEMSLLRLPYMGQKMFPFAALFGAMAAFWRLTRHSEMVVTRAVGVSAWQFLFPVLMIAILLGMFQVAAFNPLASALLSRYERLEAIRFRGRSSLLALSNSGLWLRQANEDGQSVVHANHVLTRDDDVELREVIVFVYEGIDKFIGRIDAEFARLEDGFWHMRDAWVSNPEGIMKFEKEYWLATDLTLAKIQDSFAAPETMSFWQLPNFIRTLEKSGFSAIRHRLHLHTLLATPLLMCAMILIAATFTLRQSRRGPTVAVIAGGVLTGLVLYFFSDLVFALGLSDRIPVTLAAWTPSGVATLLGLAMLLHLEDG